MKIARNTFFILSVIWGVITILFFLFRWVMDPVQMMVGQRVDAQTLLNLQKELGLHLPLYQQYFNYLNDLSPIGFVKPYHEGWAFIGNFGIKLPFLGISIYYKESVWSLFLQHIFATFLLATLAVSFAFLFAYSVGKCIYLKNSFYLKKYINYFTQLWIATPSFILGILFLWFLGLEWNFLPISGYFIQKNPLTLKSYWNLSYLILPVLTSSLRPFSIFLQMILQLLESENQKEYVKTAKAKGLNLSQIYDRHIFFNIFPTLISLFFNWWASLLSGAFFIEYIFDYPGVGKLLVEAILQNDYPMVSGLCLITALLFLLLNGLNEIVISRFKVS